MSVTYLNAVYDGERETVDELSRADFPTQKAFSAELSRLVGEYHLAGIPVYKSQRMCANWRD